MPVGRGSPHPCRPAPGAHPALYMCMMGTGSFPRVKLLGRGADHSPPSSAEIKIRAELYLDTLSGSSWPVLAWILLFRCQYCWHNQVVLWNMQFLVTLQSNAYTAFPLRSKCFLNRLQTFVICVLYSSQITTPRNYTKDSGIIVVSI